MDLSQILTPDKILLDLEATSREKLISRMLAQAVPELSASLEKELVDSLLEREKLGTISLGNGVVVPHARSKKVDTIQCVLGLSKVGMVLNSMDYQRIHFVFLLIIPETRQHHHLRLLAQFSQIVLHPKLRKQLLQCNDPVEVVRIFSEQQQFQSTL